MRPSCWQHVLRRLAARRVSVAEYVCVHAWMCIMLATMPYGCSSDWSSAPSSFHTEAVLLAIACTCVRTHVQAASGSVELWLSDDCGYRQTCFCNSFMQRTNTRIHEPGARDMSRRNLRPHCRAEESKVGFRGAPAGTPQNVRSYPDTVIWLYHTVSLRMLLWISVIAQTCSALPLCTLVSKRRSDVHQSGIIRNLYHYQGVLCTHQ
jgi:hypothetical protein